MEDATIHINAQLDSTKYNVFQSLFFFICFLGVLIFCCGYCYSIAVHRIDAGAAIRTHIT